MINGISAEGQTLSLRCLKWTFEIATSAGAWWLQNEKKSREMTEKDISTPVELRIVIRYLITY
ncbi:hypothetical protein ANCDUO_20550, partial [Ancylostoma duodenale]